MARRNRNTGDGRENVLRWLEDAGPEEIGEALLSVGVDKAASVVGYLISRFGPEVGPRIDQAVARFQQDPVRSVGKILARGLKDLLG